MVGRDALPARGEGELACQRRRHAGRIDDVPGVAAVGRGDDPELFPSSGSESARPRLWSKNVMQS